MSRNRRVVVRCLFAFVLLSLLTTLLQAQLLERLPYSGGVLMSRAIRAGRVQLQSGGGNANQLIPDLTCSPAPCVFPNVDAAEGGSNPVNEDPIAANPNNAMQLLTGGNDYNCPGLQGFFATNDGGTNWTRKCLPLQPGAFGQGDPIVGYDLNNVAFAGGIQSGSIVLSRSTDNGTNWSVPKTVTGPILGYLADKPWLEVDTNANSPFKNALYVSVTQFAFNNNSEISVSHSIDGGNTWSTVAVDTQQTFPKVDQFSDLAVGADGTVYVNWLRCRANGPSGDCGGTTANLMFSKSADGGVTRSTPIVATTTALVTDPGFCCFYGQLPNTSERVSNIPANAVRGSGATARVSSVYYDWTGTQMQVKVATSNDGGTTWGAGVRANTSNAGDQFFPWLNVAKNGRLGVTWLDRRNDPANLKYQPFFAFSINGGTSFSNSHALSSTPSDPTNDGFGGGFMGDYTGNAWNGKALYASWMDTRSGTCQDEVGGVQF